MTEELKLSDESFDETRIMWHSPESILIIQKDEFDGRPHVVVLSKAMVMEMLPHLIEWSRLSQPTPTSP